MAAVKIMNAGALKVMVGVLGADFERDRGVTLSLNSGTAGAQRDRIRDGEAADLVLLSQSAVADLGKVNLLLPGSIVDLASTVSGVVVREGAPIPDISTPQAYRQALLDARSVAYTDPKSGGTGGIMFAGLLEKLGIADAVNQKAVLCKGGYDTACAVADGRAEFATTFISEALPVKGITIVGPLPGNLNFTNMYTGAIHAGTKQAEIAQAFLRYLTNPATRPRWISAGMEPAF